MNSLESFAQIKSTLEEIRKTRGWLNTLSSRLEMIPKPVRQPQMVLQFDRGIIQLDEQNRPKFKRQGSTVCYPKGTCSYLVEIDRLHEEGFTYEEIRNKLASRLQELNRNTGVAFENDKRVKDEGFFNNFLIAIKILDGDDKSNFQKQLLGLYEQRTALGREYFIVVKRMQVSTGKESKSEHRQLEITRDEVGRKLDVLHSIMSVVIKDAWKALPKDRAQAMECWKAAAKAVEQENLR